MSKKEGQIWKTYGVSVSVAVEFRFSSIPLQQGTFFAGDIFIPVSKDTSLGFKRWYQGTCSACACADCSNRWHWVQTICYWHSLIQASVSFATEVNTILLDSQRLVSIISKIMVQSMFCASISVPFPIKRGRCQCAALKVISSTHFCTLQATI